MVSVINFNINFEEIQMNLRRDVFKNKPRQSSSKKQRKETNLNLLKIYGLKKDQQSSSKNKSKKSNNHTSQHKREITQTYDFPEFSISFIQPPSNNLMSERLQKRQKSIQVKDLQINQQKKYLEQYKINKKRQAKVCLDSYTDFILALSKIFKKMDIFNRGTINQMNISNRIPQPTLKFLGKAFKKIREDRLTLTQKQFVKICEPILRQCTTDELNNFLQAFRVEDTILKESINIPNEARPNLSPIKKRMMQQQIKFLPCSDKKSSHLQEILNVICQKEKNLGKMIQSVRDRKKAMDYSILTINQNSSSANKQNFSDKSMHKMSSTQRNRLNLQRFGQIEIKDFDDKIYQQQNPPKNKFGTNYVENFQLKIPSKVIQKQQSIRSQKHKQTFYLPPGKLEDKRNDLNVNSMRVFNQFDYNLKGDIKNETMKLNSSKQWCKIDELNQKLESYLQRSKSKIEKSKLFLMENSTLIL